MPHDISYEAQDLIRKILVTDPSKRITVSFLSFFFTFQVCAVWQGDCCVDLQDRLRRRKSSAILGSRKIFHQRLHNFQSHPVLKK